MPLFLKLWVALLIYCKIIKVLGWGKSIDDTLRKYGITFSGLHLSYETNYFNSIFFYYFNQNTAYRRMNLSKWFDCGVYVMGIGQVMSLVGLTYALCSSIRMFMSPIAHNENNMMLIPLIPGVSFPQSYIIPFWIIVFIVIVFHEVGHAGAATIERLQIQGLNLLITHATINDYDCLQDVVRFLQ